MLENAGDASIKTRIGKILILLGKNLAETWLFFGLRGHTYNDFRAEQMKNLELSGG